MHIFYVPTLIHPVKIRLIQLKTRWPRSTSVSIPKSLSSGNHKWEGYKSAVERKFNPPPLTMTQLTWAFNYTSLTIYNYHILRSKTVDNISYNGESFILKNLFTWEYYFRWYTSYCLSAVWPSFPVSCSYFVWRKTGFAPKSGKYFSQKICVSIIKTRKGIYCWVISRGVYFSVCRKNMAK